MLFQAICALFLVPATFACAYYLFLAAIGLRLHRMPSEPNAVPRHRFTILIPAHDEEAILEGVLRSCDELDYPRDKYQVCVIADNCSDRTAEVARRRGASCLERRDEQQRGKGAALTWALPRILAERPDAVMVLDADCRLDPHILRCFDRRLTAGANVLQTNDVASNPDDSIVSYVAGVANRIENELFYAPKSLLGLAVLLRGTGMGFRREVLESLPWQANSIVEDAEYTVRLAKADIAVEFVPEARVSSAFPANSDQLTVQRLRWIGGLWGLVGRAPALLATGLVRRRLLLVDLAWTLWVSGRSVVLAQLLLTICLTFGCTMAVPDGFSYFLLGLSIGLAGLHGLLFFMGAAHLGLDSRRWLLLGKSPRAIAQFLRIAAIALVGGPKAGWVRRPR